MAGYASHSQTNPTMKYCKFIIFGLYNIWRKIVFRHVGVDLNWRTPECDYFLHILYMCMAFSAVLDLAEAAFRQKC